MFLLENIQNYVFDHTASNHSLQSLNLPVESRKQIRGTHQLSFSSPVGWKKARIFRRSQNHNFSDSKPALSIPVTSMLGIALIVLFLTLARVTPFSSRVSCFVVWFCCCCCSRSCCSLRSSTSSFLCWMYSHLWKNWNFSFYL